MSSRLGRPATVPSYVHEVRRLLLQDIADVAGYRLETSLPDRKLPDVLRVHVDRPSLFLGEAKHTEGPSNLCSVDRLRQYLDWVLPLSDRDIGCILAVAHPYGLARAWQDRLGWLFRDLQIDGVVKSTDVTHVTTVTHVAFGLSVQPFVPPDRVRIGHSRYTEV